jgi:hypothetical protein
MVKRYLFPLCLLGVFFLLSTLFLFPKSCPAGQEKTTLEIPEGSAGIVGYGSLISLQSLEQSLGRKYECTTYQVHLGGYERAWAIVRSFNDPPPDSEDKTRYEVHYLQDNTRIPIDGAAELNIYPNEKSWLNAVLYVISGEDLLKLDRREWGYERVEVTDKVEEYRFKGGKVYAYVGILKGQGNPAPDTGRYILFKELLDQVTGACDQIGKTFRDEFDKSTRPPAYPIVPFAEVIWEKVK